MASAKKVLIIDDEPALLKIMGRFLTKLEYSAELAENGPKGIEILKKDPAGISGIIVDYNLPDMTCAELITQLRRLNKNVKIILSTGFSAQEVQRDKQLDVNGTLQKPFTFDDFKKTITIFN
jgi:CheY-like chemotaxis protein